MLSHKWAGKLTVFCSKCPRGGEAETIAGGPELLAVGRGTDGYTFSYCTTYLCGDLFSVLIEDSEIA